MKQLLERLYNGIVKENPTFVLMLGMCPTLAVTTSAINGIGMGLATTVVLVCSNLMVSLLRKVIPGGVRMPAYIVIVASFVTIVQMLLHAYVTSLYDALGIYIPLIVVNCIILGRAESYASKNKVLPSIFDGHRFYNRAYVNRHCARTYRFRYNLFTAHFAAKLRGCCNVCACSRCVSCACVFVCTSKQTRRKGRKQTHKIG